MSPIGRRLARLIMGNCKRKNAATAQPAGTESNRTGKMEIRGRTIFHVDVNSAFLSWSALKRLEEEPGSVDLRTIPSAVGGDIKTRHGVITAKSIPAKKFGVQTGEPVVKALWKCPQLVLVPADFETYRKYSHALMDILAKYSPLLQQMSIDEAFLDVTERLAGRKVPGERVGQGESGESTGQKTDEDREAALALAKEIRDTVRQQLGFTVNVGISSNKLLAKMASDFAKPDLTHTLYPEEVPAKMWPLPIGSLYGCGKQTAQKLQLIGVGTIGDAAAMDVTVLQSVLGQKSGYYIWKSANGISTSPVTPEREQAKSVSNERTLSDDIDRENYTADGVPVIRMLSQKVAGRLQKAGLVGQTVTFQVKSNEFNRYSRQLSLPAMTDRAGEIETAALFLADKLLNGPDGLFAEGVSVRLIGVGVSRLAEKQIHQMDLFEWAESNEGEESGAGTLPGRPELPELSALPERGRSEEKVRFGASEQPDVPEAVSEEESEKGLAAEPGAVKRIEGKKERQARLEAMMKAVNGKFGDGTLKRGKS